MAVGAQEREVLARLDAVLRERLARFGSGPDRFGLVHADLRLANLLEDGDQTYVIDFDDCGWSWFLYDFGTAVSFFEHDPRVPELTDAWVRGYRTVRALSAEDEAELPTFVMMRRLLLVAWIGSHAGTDLARDIGEEYTVGSCELAENYLSRFG
jgi:Ser/Thr protein kinase RdoA (MazF antagonist)